MPTLEQLKTMSLKEKQNLVSELRKATNCTLLCPFAAGCIDEYGDECYAIQSSHFCQAEWILFECNCTKSSEQ